MFFVGSEMFVVENVIWGCGVAEKFSSGRPKHFTSIGLLEPAMRKKRVVTIYLVLEKEYQGFWNQSFD